MPASERYAWRALAYPFVAFFVLFPVGLFLGAVTNLAVVVCKGNLEGTGYVCMVRGSRDQGFKACSWGAVANLAVVVCKGTLEGTGCGAFNVPGAAGVQNEAFPCSCLQRCHDVSGQAHVTALVNCKMWYPTASTPSVTELHRKTQGTEVCGRRLAKRIALPCSTNAVPAAGGAGSAAGTAARARWCWASGRRCC